MRKSMMGGAAAVAFAASLALAAPGAALAAQIDQNSDPQSANTNVSYEVGVAYTVIIPAEVHLSDSGATATIEAADVLIKDGEKIVVSIDQDSKFQVVQGDDILTYTVAKGSGTASSTPTQLGNVREVPAGTTAENLLKQ